MQVMINCDKNSHMTWKSATPSHDVSLGPSLRPFSLPCWKPVERERESYLLKFIFEWVIEDSNVTGNPCLTSRFAS